MNDAEIRKYLDSLPRDERAWQQGMLEMQGYYLKQWDDFTCLKCGLTYELRRKPHFLPDATVEYLSRSPHCPKCGVAD